jgi:predicted O-linked N-acetylglucosamine transferase (SPINDLY family)
MAAPQLVMRSGWVCPLTTAGSTPSSRVRVILLSHMGLEGFIAYDAEDFVIKGLVWAQDIRALAEIRAGVYALISLQCVNLR